MESHTQECPADSFTEEDCNCGFSDQEDCGHNCWCSPWFCGCSGFLGGQHPEE